MLRVSQAGCDTPDGGRPPGEDTGYTEAKQVVQSQTATVLPDQRSPAFVVPETDSMEDNFSTDLAGGGKVWYGDDSNALY